MFSLEEFKECGWELKNVTYDLHSTDLPNVKTEYEEKFSAKGQPFFRLEAIKPKVQKGGLTWKHRIRGIVGGAHSLKNDLQGMLLPILLITIIGSVNIFSATYISSIYENTGLFRVLFKTYRFPISFNGNRCYFISV